MLNEGDQKTWRHTHIPHRVRAAIARLDMRKSILRVYPTIDASSRNREERIYWRCATDSIHEGRLAATRYLIEFIGIQEDNSGNPARRDKDHRHAADINITDLGGTLFSPTNPDAELLAKI